MTQDDLNNAFKLQHDRIEKDTCGAYLLFFYHVPKNAYYHFTRVKLKQQNGNRTIREFEKWMAPEFEFDDSHVVNSIIPRFSKIPSLSNKRYWYPILSDEIDLKASGLK